MIYLYLEKEMATHYSTLAWKIPWTEEPGRLQSMGSQRVGHDWATSLSLSFKCFVTCLLLPFRLFVCNFLSFLLKPSGNQEWFFFFFPNSLVSEALPIFQGSSSMLTSQITQSQSNIYSLGILESLFPIPFQVAIISLLYFYSTAYSELFPPPTVT